MIPSKSITPTSLRCEYAEQPLNLGTTFPRFSWIIQPIERGSKQSAYQILVASDRSLLAQDTGDLWDSGKVAGNNTVGIGYAGKPLHSRQQCWWKVRIWDHNDRASEYSGIEHFGIGLLDQEDWQAHWIASPSPKRGVAPYFRTSLQIEKPVSQALLYICGLGYYELHLNGEKIGDHVMDPGWTNYVKRALYAAYDVTDTLTVGENALGAVLGEGWHGNDHPRFTEGNKREQPEWIGFPCLILQLHITFADGSETCITSNDSWLVSEGPIIANNIYDGETYDARQELADWDTSAFRRTEGDGWVSAVNVDGPKGQLVPQLLEPIKIVRDIAPVSISKPQSGVQVIDFGQNFAGWIRLSVTGTAGTEIKIKYAEILDEAGFVNQEPLRMARCTDRYILRGSGVETFEPRFTYHGFRYAQIEGYPGELTPENVVGRVVRSAVVQTGAFTCSNELLNAIQRNVLWTEEGNLHSLPTDCPQRDERMGWLNDMTVRVEEAFYNFGMARLLSKWEDDITDAQHVDGAITDTAPLVFGGGPADPVSTSFLLIPWLLHTWYGDKRTLERHFEHLKRWNAYLGSRTKDGIVDYSYWGDWAQPASELAEKGSAKSGTISR